MKIRFLLLALIFVFIFGNYSFAKDKLINESFWENKNHTQQEDINPYSDLFDEKYSYNETEKTEQKFSNIKTNYDFNMKNDSQMSVGLKGFSFKFKY